MTDIDIRIADTLEGRVYTLVLSDAGLTQLRGTLTRLAHLRLSGELLGTRIEVPLCTADQPWKPASRTRSEG